MALKRPPLTKAQFLDTLERRSLVQTVAALRDLIYQSWCSMPSGSDSQG
jgi:hypothetical protein